MTCIVLLSVAASGGFFVYTFLLEAFYISIPASGNGWMKCMI